MDLTKLSKIFAYALRHDPAKYAVTLDEQGWTNLDFLIKSIQEHHSNMLFSVQDVYDIVKNSDKKRFEIEGVKIRAYYGHSVDQEILKEAKEPPSILYHGTSSEIISTILKFGLQPMSRQKVHLSTDYKTALLTGKRKSSNVIVLKIKAKEAFDNGVKFYLGNQDVWLCDEVLPQYIEV
jgi:putative RNA 2'-phosphotransferase